MFNPFDDDEAAKFVRKLTSGKSITPISSTLGKALRKAEKSWLDGLPLCNQALAAATIVAAARGQAGTIPVPDEVTAWISKQQYQPDEVRAEEAADVVDLVRTNSALQEIADDTGWRAWKQGCSQLAKRLRKPVKKVSQPVAKSKPTSKLSPASARKALQKKRGEFESVKGGVRFTNWAEKALGDEDLELLTLIPNVREVALEGQAFTADGLKHLGSLAELESLDLRKMTIESASLESLLALKSLRTLRLRNCAMDDHLKVISRLKNLRELDLFNSKHVTDKALGSLKTMQQLKELNLLRTNVSPKVGGKLAEVLKKTDVKFDS